MSLPSAKMTGSLRGRASRSSVLDFARPSLIPVPASAWRIAARRTVATTVVVAFAGNAMMDLLATPMESVFASQTVRVRTAVPTAAARSAEFVLDEIQCATSCKSASRNRQAHAAMATVWLPTKRTASVAPWIAASVQSAVTALAMKRSYVRFVLRTVAPVRTEIAAPTTIFPVARTGI